MRFGGLGCSNVSCGFAGLYEPLIHRFHKNDYCSIPYAIGIAIALYIQYSAGMDSFTDVFNAIGNSPAALRDALGVKYQTAAAMLRRKKLPKRYFPDAVRIAQQKGVEDLTLETLFRIERGQA